RRRSEPVKRDGVEKRSMNRSALSGLLAILGSMTLTVACAPMSQDLGNDMAAVSPAGDPDDPGDAGPAPSADAGPATSDAAPPEGGATPADAGVVTTPTGVNPFDPNSCAGPALTYADIAAVKSKAWAVDGRIYFQKRTCTGSTCSTWSPQPHLTFG